MLYNMSLIKNEKFPLGFSWINYHNHCVIMQYKISLNKNCLNQIIFFHCVIFITLNYERCFYRFMTYSGGVKCIFKQVLIFLLKIINSHIIQIAYIHRIVFNQEHRLNNIEYLEPKSKRIVDICMSQTFPGKTSKFLMHKCMT